MFQGALKIYLIDQKLHFNPVNPTWNYAYLWSSPMRSLVGYNTSKQVCTIGIHGLIPPNKIYNKSVWSFQRSFIAHSKLMKTNLIFDYVESVQYKTFECLNTGLMLKIIEIVNEF